MISKRSIILTALLIPLVAGRAQSDSGATVQDSRLFVGSDLWVMAGFTGATIAMFPLDRHLASVVRDEDLLANRTLDRASKFFQFFGGPGPFIIGSSMYAVGRVTGVRRAAELGLHGTEAIVVGIGIANVIKNIAGRERPYVTADTNPHSFGLMRGFRDRDARSFPSGHSTAAFSAAAAVTAETRYWWPKGRWVIGTLMYGGATLVGLSRMYNDQHWASDVVMGAAIGTFAGQKTVRFNHTHTGNRLDRWLLGTGSPQTSSLRLYMGDDNAIGVMADLRW